MNVKTVFVWMTVCCLVLTTYYYAYKDGYATGREFGEVQALLDAGYSYENIVRQTT